MESLGLWIHDPGQWTPDVHLHDVGLRIPDVNFPRSWSGATHRHDVGAWMLPHSHTSQEPAITTPTTDTGFTNLSKDALGSQCWRARTCCAQRVVAVPAFGVRKAQSTPFPWIALSEVIQGRSSFLSSSSMAETFANDRHNREREDKRFFACRLFSLFVLLHWFSGAYRDEARRDPTLPPTPV